MDASGKISRTHPTAVLISCVPPSQRRLYVTVNFGGGLTSPCRGRCCCVDSVVVVVVAVVVAVVVVAVVVAVPMAAADFASIFRFRSMVLVIVVSPSSLGMMLLLLLLMVSQPQAVFFSMAIVSIRFDSFRFVM